MPNAALIPDRNVSVPILADVVHGYPEASFRLSTSASKSPLEDGVSATDHAVALPDEIELEGWVSDLARSGSGPARDDAAKAWETLQRIQKESEPIEVITPWGTYDEALIVRCKARQTGGGMQFTLKLQEIIRVGVSDSAISDSATGPARFRPSRTVRGNVPSPSIPSRNAQPRLNRFSGGPLRF